MDSLSAKQHKRHPAGLWWVAVSYAFYLFGFGTVNSNLIIYITQHLHLSTHYAYGLFGAFNALIFTFPVMCGYAISRIGYQRTANFGTIVTIIGILILSLDNQTALLIGLALFAAGYGFNTPAYFCIPGFLYSSEDTRRESGVTTFLRNNEFWCSNLYC